MWYMTTSEAAWLAIARDLSQRIGSGELKVGDAIPSREQLRRRYGVAEGTSRRAIQHLRAVGVLKGEQGRGVFVQRIPVPADLETRPTLDRRVAELERRVAEQQERIDALESGADPGLSAEVRELRTQLATLYSLTRNPYPPGATIRRRAASGG